MKIRSRKKIYLLFSLLILGLFSFFFSYNKKLYHASLPIYFKTSTQLPYINVDIQGKEYPLVFDLGSRLELQIYDHLLAHLQKTSHGTEKWKNCRGTQFTSPLYSLNDVHLGSLTFKYPHIVGFSTEKEGETIINTDLCSNDDSPSETVGYVGRGLLKKVNVLLDFSQSKVIFTNSLKELKKDDYDVVSYKKIPFVIGSKGITLNVTTDLGTLHLILDTGSSVTVLHESLYPQSTERGIFQYNLPMVTSSQFILNETDFGEQDLFFFNMTHELKDIDGVLGMDFLKKHPIYIDFSKKVLYIQK